MAIIRWVLVVPAAAIALLLGVLLGEFTNIRCWGLDASNAFWGVTDMNGQWYSGTIMMISTRGLSTAAATYSIFWVSPYQRKKVVKFASIAISIIYGLIFVNGVYSQGLSGSFSFWYRSILDMGVTLIATWSVYFSLADD